MDRANKIKFFLIASLIIITAALVVYFVFLKPELKLPPQPPAPASLQGSITQVEAFPLKILLPDYANGWVFYQGYYQGELLKGDIATGKIELIMEKDDLPTISELIVSPSGTKILLKGQEEQGLAGYYLVETGDKKISTKLNPGIRSTAFLSDEKIVYHYKAEGVNSLNTAGPNGQNWKKITDLKDESVFLDTVEIGEIIYSTSEITTGFNILKPDGSGKRTIKLPISVNVNKLVWSSDGKWLIAALREIDKSTDSFYKINLETSRKEEIKYQSQISLDAQNLILTNNGKILYFTSDDYLYKMEL